MTDGIRTRDNRSHNPAIYQLIYGHHTLFRGGGYLSGRRSRSQADQQGWAQGGVVGPPGGGGGTAGPGGITGAEVGPNVATNWKR